MKRKRTPQETRRDILFTLQDNSGTLIKTHLLTKANISTKYLKEKIKYLIEDGLIEEYVSQKKRKSITYRLTEKGHKEAEKWRTLESR